MDTNKEITILTAGEVHAIVARVANAIKPFWIDGELNPVSVSHHGCVVRFHLPAKYERQLPSGADIRFSYAGKPMPCNTALAADCSGDLHAEAYKRVMVALASAEQHRDSEGKGE